ncbi:MAG: hypothetical protein M1834_007975, partial [Cirrosporium novae-zelandiae]
MASTRPTTPPKNPYRDIFKSFQFEHLFQSEKKYLTPPKIPANDTLPTFNFLPSSATATPLAAATAMSSSNPTPNSTSAAATATTTHPVSILSSYKSDPLGPNFKFSLDADAADPINNNEQTTNKNKKTNDDSSIFSSPFFLHSAAPTSCAEQDDDTELTLYEWFHMRRIEFLYHQLILRRE